jgi:hypothetical protein
LREATYPPAAVNVLDVSSERMPLFRCSCMAAFGCSLRRLEKYDCIVPSVDVTIPVPGTETVCLNRKNK